MVALGGGVGLFMALTAGTRRDDDTPVVGLITSALGIGLGAYYYWKAVRHDDAMTRYRTRRGQIEAGMPTDE